MKKFIFLALCAIACSSCSSMRTQELVGENGQRVVARSKMYTGFAGDMRTSMVQQFNAPPAKREAHSAIDQRLMSLQVDTAKIPVEEKEAVLETLLVGGWDERLGEEPPALWFNQWELKELREGRLVASDAKVETGPGLLHDVIQGATAGATAGVVGGVIGSSDVKAISTSNSSSSSNAKSGVP